MAALDSSGTTAKVKYNLNDSLQCEMFFDIVKDMAEGHEIWKFIRTGGRPEDPVVPTKPVAPQPVAPATDVTRIEAEEHIHALRQYEKQKAALRSIKTWIKESIDPTAFVHVQNKDTIREMLQSLKAQYMKTEQELKVDFHQEYQRLKKPPRSKGMETWVDQWNQFYFRATKHKQDEYTGYNAVLDFLRAAQPVAPSFANSFYQKTIDLFEAGNDVPTIPTLTRRLLLELRLNGTLTSNKGTGFATLQGLDTDETTPPTPQSTTPAPKPSGNSNKQSKGQKSPRKCLCGEQHNYAECLYLIPSLRPEGWVPNPQTMAQVSDALIQSEKKQQIIKKLVEKSKGGGNGNNKAKSKESSTTTEDQQNTGLPTNFCTMGLIQTEEELKNTVILDGGASNHIFNSRDRFIEYTPCVNYGSILTGTNLAEVEGIGRARVTVTTNTGTKEITLRNSLYIPSYQANLVSQAALQHQGVFHHPRAGELLYNDQHLCKVILRGKHYVLEAAPRNGLIDGSDDDDAYVEDFGIPATAMATQRRSAMPRKCTVSAKLLHYRLGHPSDEVIEHLEEASRDTRVQGKREGVCDPCRVSKAHKIISRRTPEPSTYPFQKVHFDLITETPAYNGDRYVLHFVDSYTNYHRVYTIPNKSAINTGIIYFVNWVKNKFNLNIQVLHTDGEKSISNSTKNFLNSLGITLQQTAPHCPEQNGKAEEAGGELSTVSRCMHSASKLPPKLWPESYTTSAELLNLRPSKVLGWKTPFEVLQRYLNGISKDDSTPKKLEKKKWKNLDDITKPMHAHLVAYGAKAFPIIHGIPASQKVVPRAHIGYHIGYDGTNIYRIWIPSQDTVSRYRDVTFDENSFYDPNDKEEPLEPPILEPPKLPEFHAYVPPDAIDIPEPTYREITWTDLQYTPPRQEAARNTELPEQPLAPEDITNLMKRTEHGLVTPFSTPGVHTPASTSTPDPEDSQDNTGPETGSANSDSPFGSDRQHADDNGEDRASPATASQQTPVSRQRRTEPANTAPRSREISADPDAPENILPNRTRGKQRRLEHGLLIAQVEQDSGIHTAFNAALKYKLHQSTLPAPPAHYKDLEKHQYRLEFKNAAQQEFQTLVRKGTFKKVPWDKTRKLLPLRWVFTYKFDTNGYLTRFKARLCARGDLQAATSSYSQDTYAATLAARIFRALMAITAAFDFETCQFDATNAFTNAELDEEVYAPYPEGFRQHGFCLLLLKALYGLRQAPRLWHEKFARTLHTMGLKQAGDESCLFVNEWLIIFFYVDDVVALYHRRNSQRWESFKQNLFQQYEFKDMGEVKWFIGIRVIRDRSQRKLWLCQDSYIDRVASRFSTPSHTRYRSPLPVEDLTQYVRESDDPASTSAIFGYQQRVGSVLYPACLTRPDVAFSASHLAEFSANPHEAHINAIDRVIAYLVKSKTLAIEYSAPSSAGQPVFEVFSDSAFADDSITRRSSAGFLITLFGGPIDWKSYKQRSVTTSTTEAELHALTEAARVVYYWKRIFQDLDFCLNHDITTGCDNLQTIRLLTTETPKLITKLRHVDIKRHWLRQEVQAGRLKVCWIPTNEMPADGLTKALSIQQHDKFVKQLGLVPLENIDINLEHME